MPSEETSKQRPNSMFLSLDGQPRKKLFARYRLVPEGKQRCVLGKRGGIKELWSESGIEPQGALSELRSCGTSRSWPQTNWLLNITWGIVEDDPRIGAQYRLVLDAVEALLPIKETEELF